MKYKNIFWGLILIVIGALFILKNTGVIYFSWRDVFRLWPVVLILWGIAILPLRCVYKIILSLITVIVAFLILSQHCDSNESRFYWRWFDDDYSYEERHEWTDQQYAEPYTDNIAYAELLIDAAAGVFEISGTSDEFLSFYHEGNTGPYELKSSLSDSSKKLIMEFQDDIIGPGKIRNNTEISLNPSPVWDIEVDAGAARLNLDLSSFKIDELEIDGGATSVTIIMGDLMDVSYVSIEAGASSLTLKVPENIGCRLESESFLSSKRLKGFDKASDGYYYTENYESADKKMFIDVDTAISSIKVLRY